MHRSGKEDAAYADKLLQGVINRTRERFAISRLTAEFQIAFAHDEFTRDDHLKWKAMFRGERRDRSKEHNNRKRVKEKNKEANRASNFGGAATELQNLANHLFSNGTVNPQTS